ncbi:hypothetical protein A7982_13289 [Minicystis rosea]|nr:hypothetical protein A7982_13289 [Minicystis rosea]
MTKEGGVGNVITTHSATSFSAVSLSPHLFRHGGQVVALYAPDDADAAEVLAAAREVYGDVAPMTHP